MSTRAVGFAVLALVMAVGLAPAEAKGGAPSSFPPGRDTTAPTITCPSEIAVQAYASGGARVTYWAYATDNRDPSPTFTISHASGSLFPVGTTTVTVTAEDWKRNTSTKTFDVTVQAQVGDLSYKAIWSGSNGSSYFEWDITIALDGTVSGTGRQTNLLVDAIEWEGGFYVDTLPSGLSGAGVLSGTVASDGTFQLESSSTYWYWKLGEYDADGSPVYRQGTAGFSGAATAYSNTSAYLSWSWPDPLASPSNPAFWYVQ
jgi:hypothetical protein